jgi:hypothetical protein
MGAKRERRRTGNPARGYFCAPLQSFLKLLTDPRFANRAAELGGLDVSAAGAMRWAP